jgi:hypothetical protein
MGYERTSSIDEQPERSLTAADEDPNGVEAVEVSVGLEPDDAALAANRSAPGS